MIRPVAQRCGYRLAPVMARLQLVLRLSNADRLIGVVPITGYYPLNDFDGLVGAHEQGRERRHLNLSLKVTR